ncbi:MAG: TetR/AcrR family transcriptional regulator [Coriobacteriales bacterium]
METTSTTWDENAAPAHAAESLSRRRGRPRASAEQQSQQRAAILQAAAHLFRERGYANTNMTAIAKAVGLNQSSLYYWFSSKEQLLDELLMEEFRSCGLRGAIFSATQASCAERLFALVFRRTAKYCKLPIDVYEAEAVVNRTPDVLEHFFLELEEYRENMRRLLAHGIAAGELRAMPSEDALWLVMSSIASMQHEFHRQQAGQGPAVVGSPLPAEVGVETMGTNLGTMGASVEPAGAGLGPASAGVGQASEALEPAGVGDEPAGMGVEAYALRTARLVLSALATDPAAVDAAEQGARSRFWLANA